MVVACLIIVSSQDLSFENLTLNQSIWRLEKFAGGGGGLFDYSVTPGPGPDLELDNYVGINSLRTNCFIYVLIWIYIIYIMDNYLNESFIP